MFWDLKGLEMVTGLLESIEFGELELLTYLKLVFMSCCEPKYENRITEKRYLESGGGVVIDGETGPEVKAVHKSNLVQEPLAILLLDIRLEHVPTLPVPLKHALHTDIIHINILSVERNKLTPALEHGNGVEVR
jgi:hypothetical protein